MSTLDQARSAKKKAHTVFSKIAPVVGVGITRLGDGYALKVNITHALDADVEVPDEVEGVPVRLEVVGELKKR